MKTLDFRVADLPYRISFDNEDIDYQWYLPSHGRFWQKEPSDAPILNLEVGEGRVADSHEGLETVGNFPSGDSSYDVFRRPEGGFGFGLLICRALPCACLPRVPVSTNAGLRFLATASNNASASRTA